MIRTVASKLVVVVVEDQGVGLLPPAGLPVTILFHLDQIKSGTCWPNAPLFPPVPFTPDQLTLPQ